MNPLEWSRMNITTESWIYQWPWEVIARKPRTNAPCQQHSTAKAVLSVSGHKHPLLSVFHSARRKFAILLGRTICVLDRKNCCKHNHPLLAESLLSTGDEHRDLQLKRWNGKQEECRLVKFGARQHWDQPEVEVVSLHYWASINVNSILIEAQTSFAGLIRQSKNAFSDAESVSVYRFLLPWAQRRHELLASTHSSWISCPMMMMMMMMRRRKKMRMIIYLMVRWSGADPTISDGLKPFACGIFILNLAWTGSCGDFAKFLSKRSLHDAVQVLNRRSCGDPGEILFRGFLHKDIADDIS